MRSVLLALGLMGLAVILFLVFSVVFVIGYVIFGRNRNG